MKKTWLYPAIASIALLASACANNAAPNYTTPNRTTTNQVAPRVSNFDGLHTRTYDGVTTRNFDGLHIRNYDGYGTTNTPGTYNAYTNGVRPYTAFPDGNVGTGTAGIRGTAGGGPLTGTNRSIYQNHAFNRAGVMQTAMPRMGYIQTDRQHLMTTGVNQVYVDREALARAVGNTTASCPGVLRSTVLVSDEDIFVGLHTQGVDPQTAKKQARMNAMAVSPRYYKVYVTDKPGDIQEISRVAAHSSNVGNAHTQSKADTDMLIKRMGGKTDTEQIRGAK